MRLTLPTLILAAGLTLTACSTTPTDTPTTEPTTSAPTPTATQETPTTYEHGEYQAIDPDTGTPLTLTVPAEGEGGNLHPDVEPLATHLASMGAPVSDFSFITVDVDNRDGNTKVDPSQVWVTNQDGEPFPFLKDEDVIEAYAPEMEWPDDVEDPYYTNWNGDIIEETEYDTLSSESTTAYNDALNGVDAGTRETLVFVYDGSAGELPEVFGTIAVDGAGSTSQARP